MVQNHLLSQCHKIERWVYGCNNMSSATRYDKGFEVMRYILEMIIKDKKLQIITDLSN